MLSKMLPEMLPETGPSIKPLPKHQNLPLTLLQGLVSTSGVALAHGALSFFPGHHPNRAHTAAANPHRTALEPR